MSLAVRKSMTADLMDAMSGLAGGIMASLRRHRARAANHAVLRGLSDDQLRDIGIDRGAIEPAQPTIEVQAGLMPNLMNMR